MIQNIDYILRDIDGKIKESYLEYDTVLSKHVNVDTNRFLDPYEMVDATITFADENIIDDLLLIKSSNDLNPWCFLGIWIRTNFGLWLHENPYTRTSIESNVSNPKNVSLNIMKSVWRTRSIINLAITNTVYSKPLDL